MQFDTPKMAKQIKLTAGQRKILADKVRANAVNAIEAIRNGIPKEPKLPAFIQQAILNGELIKRDDADIQRSLRSRVEVGYSVMDIPISVFYEIPAEYERLRLVYDRIYKDAQTKIKAICNERDTICMKIEVGSIDALQALIYDIDNAGNGELRLTPNNSALLLGAPTEEE